MWPRHRAEALFTLEIKLFNLEIKLFILDVFPCFVGSLPPVIAKGQLFRSRARRSRFLSAPDLELSDRVSLRYCSNLQVHVPIRVRQSAFSFESMG